MSVKTKNYRKHEAQHSKERVAERYGHELNKRDLDEIVKIILSPNRNNKVFLRQQEDGASHWLVLYDGSVYRLVFDERTHATRTFLEMRPVDHQMWRNTHDRSGNPTLGDVVRISKLKLK